MKQSVVSIIVTTKNESQVLERLLKSVKNQTYSAIELIVVDNHSTDTTRKIAEKYTKKVFDFGPERSAQRNYGAKKSKGEYILFLDADMELTPKVVKACVEMVEKNKKIAAVAIPEKSVAHLFWEKVKAFERSFYNESGDATTDAERFFKRSIFEKVGGYDESITGPEDWDLPERIHKKGFGKARINERLYHHERVVSPYALAKKKYYYALTSHRYLKKHKIATFSPKTIYFLRPIFYQQWRKLLSHPILSIAMFYMFSLELLAGGTGFLVGKYKNL